MRPFRTVGIGITAAAIAAITVTMAAPASADPSTSFVGVGSDTIQDLGNQFAGDEPAALVGNWNAVNPVTQTPHEVITPKPGCSMTRPNGSGEGVAALRLSINPASTATPKLTFPPSQGCIDFARSSSGPGGNLDTTAGKLQYIPIALDAVALATGPTSGTGATTITQADKFSLGTTTNPGELIKLYRDCTQVTVNGVTYDPNPNGPAAGAVAIHPYLPQTGSGTRNFWAAQVGIADPTAPPTCVKDHAPDNTPVEEHDGTIFTKDPAAIAPFSIAQWVSQSNGNNDRRHGAILHSLAALPGGASVAPLNSFGTLNTAFPITREVYIVVERAKISPVGLANNPNFNQTLYNLFVTGNSQICQDGFAISNNGFAPLDNAPLGHHCGDVVDTLRAFTTI